MRFKKELVDLILQGKKTMTSRSKSHFRPGDITNLMANKDYSKLTGKYIKMTSVYPKRLVDFTVEEAEKEGFSNLEEFKNFWIKNIGEWTPEERVEVHEFRLIDFKPEDFSRHKCDQCGSCCLQIHGINHNSRDIKRWVKQGRNDILQYCFSWDEDCLELPEEEATILDFMLSNDNDVWFDPLTSDEIFLCPFLNKVRGKNKFECLIQETKPEICRKYLCKPSQMLGIEKKPFQENLKEYNEERKRYPSVKDSQYAEEKPSPP